MQKTVDAEAWVPRGMSRDGLVLFSYGFRPFFLAAALWAILSMLLWTSFLTMGLPVATEYGTLYWHAHEMLFGFAPAILAGFLLTAIPNWTGRLPIAGRPLIALFSLWCAGRIAMLASGSVGVTAAAVVDGLFLPVMLVLCTREVAAGRKWKDLKVIAGLLVLSLANICFQLQVVQGGSPELSIRLGLGAYVLLVTIVGGRILPSFTRNWINQFGRTDFPVPYNRFDAATIIIGALSLGLWSILPESVWSGLFGLAAAVLNIIRLVRWRGWGTWPEPIVFVLHAAFAFVPFGFAAIALQAAGLPELAVLHVFAIGSISLMMLAVMTRASRGHTGRKLKSAPVTNISYVVLAAVALVRPAAELLPEYSTPILFVAAAGWTAAFSLFIFEHASMLCIGRKPLTVRGT
ncbi:NnrS family protein [Rhizobium leguminosarum]|uniref:NnrS family protein n=1 Tax=Rhizobium leguminosarum TaxID=384 RepID=UPI0014412857|nr:NnrS family protein [Rhizobium leguminosarum]MBY5838555.1 short-chain dehydrogenase [Rhizobium leguminosarum]NKM76687.1 short-chain dehydrogenase [Rhizobium leguminosarum bv. viciae]QSZ10904.1 NnrS family protein [Rhizobium leguminosarum]